MPHADHLVVRTVDVGEDLVVAIRSSIEDLERSAHRDRTTPEPGGAVRRTRDIDQERIDQRTSAHRGSVVVAVVGVVEVDPDARVRDVELTLVRVVEQEVHVLDVVEVAQRLRLPRGAARVGGALAPPLLLAREHGEVERPEARRDLGAEQPFVLAAVGDVLGARQAQVRVAEVERLDQVVLVALVVDGDPVRERDLDARVLEQVHPDAVRELSLEADVEILLHVERGKERALLPQRSGLHVGPVARSREPDVLLPRHVERGAARAEKALHPSREWGGKLEREATARRGTIRRRGPERVDAAARTFQPRALEVAAAELFGERVERTLGALTQRDIAHLRDRAERAGIGIDGDPQLPGVVGELEADRTAPEVGQGREDELVLEHEPGDRLPRRGKGVRREGLVAVSEPKARKTDEKGKGRQREGCQHVGKWFAPPRGEALRWTLAGRAGTVKAVGAKFVRPLRDPWGRLADDAHPSVLHPSAASGSLPPRLRRNHVHPRDGRVCSTTSIWWSTGGWPRSSSPSSSCSPWATSSPCPPPARCWWRCS